MSRAIGKIQLRSHVGDLKRGNLSTRLWDNRNPGGLRSKSFQSRLAMAMDPNKGRCLLTNESGDCVDTCCLIPSATETSLVRQLEDAWGMQPGSLNVNAYTNLVFFRADWRRLFHAGQLMLVPELEDLEVMTSFQSTERTTDIHELWGRVGKTIFRYDMFPTSSIQYPILRFEWPYTTHTDYLVHVPPFTTVGKVESQVHPQYVTFNTGKKLDEGGVANVMATSGIAGIQKSIDIISSSYKKWTA